MTRTGDRTRLKKFVEVKVAVACAVLLFALGAGCAEEQTDQARAIMTQGDVALANLNTDFYEYLGDIERAVTVLKERPPSEWLELLEDFPGQVGALRARYATLKQQVADISAEFRETLDLIGVEDYVKYSELRTSYLLLVDRQLEEVEDYIGEFFNLFNTMGPNPPPEQAIVVCEIADIVNEFKEGYDPLELQKQGLAQQAEIFKWEHALIPAGQ